METTITKNYAQTLRNAINTTRQADHREVKENLAKGLSMLFFDNGNDYTWGIDSHYSTQVGPAIASCKAHVINYLKLSLTTINN